MHSSSILILTKKVTNRVSYIMSLMLGEKLGLEVRITQDKEEFDSCDQPKFSYGIPVEGNSLYFAAHELLFESGISVKSLNYFPFEGHPAFFGTYDKASRFPFDPFAASFYLVSRYEEYLPHLRDEHGRFLATESDAFKHGFLSKPLVDIWANRIGQSLKERYPGLEMRNTTFRFTPTIDIDAAYAYKHKGLTRAIGGFVKAIRKKNGEEIRSRIKVLLNREKDPFDTFDYLFRLREKYKLKPLFFILMADYGEKDKNIPVNNRQFLHLIKLISDYAEVGIHPSYASFAEHEKLEVEINRLSRVLHQDISKSRQHFLRLEFPITYRNLINLEITDDYTMGYADMPGFRASTCSSFAFYDLDLDVATHLRIHPFAIMDGTLHDYMRLTPLQSKEIIQSLIKEIQDAGGTFIPVWHNQTLNDTGEWSGWKEVFENMVEAAVKAETQR